MRPSLLKLLVLSAAAFLVACNQNTANTTGSGSKTAAAPYAISGAGATFPAPVYGKWAMAYREATGTSINYQPIGSGGGINQIEAKTVTFGATDMPLAAAELEKQGLLQFPTVIGGDVPVLNVAGIGAGELVLDGPTLANIFLGKITKWNDPAIRKLNAKLTLPNQAIITIHRSDGSGTTFIFTDYLAKVSPEWKEKVGAAVSVNWPNGIGAKGNEGVAGILATTSGGIGYVEFAYAKQTGIAYAKMINRNGKVVAPDAPTFAAAAASATWDPANGFATILTDQSGDDAWPIVGATFILVHKQPQNVAATREALKFFNWAYANGDPMAAELAFVPFPETVKETIKMSWSGVEGWNGGN